MAVIKRSQHYSPIKTQAIQYSDFSTSFKIHPNKLDLVMENNTDAVSTSIKNLLLTNRGEKFFRPFLGSNINASLFENFDIVTKNSIQSAIESTINNYEPRATIQSIEVDYLIDDDAVQARITFTTINSTTPTILELLLDRIR